MTSSRSCMQPSRRLEKIPPYLFAQLEQKIAAKRAAGVDVISLGIGDPDMPTYAPIVSAAQRAVADPSTHTYPSNRGRREFREAVAAFYDRRFGVTLDPETEVMTAIGAKECIFNLSLAFLNPGDAALAADPGYPVYTGGPLMADAEPVLMALVPELGFAPDLGAIPAEALARARLMFINYPNNPTGAVVPDGLFEAVVKLAGEAGFLAVHDNAYSETTYDGYVAPSFLATPGAKEIGVEGFSLSKGYNMTGRGGAAGRRRQRGRRGARGVRRPRRGDRQLLATEVEHRLRVLRRGPARRGRRPESRGGRRGQGDECGLPAPPRPGLCRAEGGRGAGDAATRHDLRVGAGAGGLFLGRGLLRARTRARGGGHLARRRLWPQRGRLLPDLVDHARRSPGRGGRAPARTLGRRRPDLRRRAPSRGASRPPH